MSDRGLRGAFVRALPAHIPQAPFRIYQGEDHPPRSFESIGAIAKLVMTGKLEAEQTYLLGGKIRPLLILQSRPRGRLHEYATLRLLRLSKLESDEERGVVRAGREPSFFYLDPERFAALRVECAVDLNSLVRIHASAIVGSPLAWLDDHELETIGSRLVGLLDLDIGSMLRAEAIRVLRNRGVIER